MTNRKRRRVSIAGVAALLSLLLLTTTACRGTGSDNAAQANAGPASASPSSKGSPGPDTTDATKLDSEIANLEKEAEKNPGNSEITAGLARVYVRRGNVLRETGRLKEALLDYQRALRNDPDNDEATRNAAEIAPQVEGTPTGEYGEPAPLPITPNVTGSEEKASPTPKKP
jgi:cytochrome c-type biogenesis protein CcmH/NrfG